MKILIIQTGGTIDKDYPRTTKGYAFEITTPAAERILKRVKPHFDYEIVPLLQKDSLDMTDKDRQKIRELCIESPCRKIIITHGTDTMDNTAHSLTGIAGKTIILTGAFLPERFKDSDADFNMGMAVCAIQILSEGIFLARNGMLNAIDINAK